MAATSRWARIAAWCRRTVARLPARLRAGAPAPVAGLLGGLLAGGSAAALTLPEDRADVMYHLYHGDGDTAQGPALLVRKSLLDKVSLSAGYYLDMVSNASIDVVTTASKYSENRNEYSLGVDYVYRDALMSLSGSSSKEPDYKADAINVDVTQEVFGGLTTIALGFTRGSDKVMRSNSPEFSDVAKHWRYRFSVSQVLTPRWIGGVSFEAVSSDGFLGSPYRAARVFGATVPERIPRTRSSRAIKLRAIGDIGAERGATVRAEYRYFWDTWDIAAHSLEFGYSRYFGERWLADGTLRVHSQRNALFYSDNFTTETTYISRSRQFSTFTSFGPGIKAAYTWKRVPGRYEVKLHGLYEFLRFDFKDFTDVRSGSSYSHNAHVLQLFMSATF